MIALVLEDTDGVFQSLDGKIRRMCKNLDTEVKVFHRRSRAAFDQKLDEIQKDSTPTILIFCDIEDRQGESVQLLRQYMKGLWEAIVPPWVQRRPMIVFTRSDDTYEWMKKTDKLIHRTVPSAVILQTQGTGRDPMAELREALTGAIQACSSE